MAKKKSSRKKSRSATSRGGSKRSRGTPTKRTRPGSSKSGARSASSAKPSFVPTKVSESLEAAIRLLSGAKVDFVVVGMFGINLQARDPSESFETNDLDVLLRANIPTLKSALTALSNAGFTFASGGEPFIDTVDEQALAAVLRSQATLRGLFDGTNVLDLMLEMTGWSHDEVASDAVVFKAYGHDVRVARLERLIESKRRAGRPKDLAFLAHYAAVMEGKKDS